MADPLLDPRVGEHYRYGAVRRIESEPGLIGLSPHHVVVASPS